MRLHIGSEHDGAEPDDSGIADQDGLLEDRGEPSLGWTIELDQNSPHRMGNLEDREPDGDEADHSSSEGDDHRIRLYLRPAAP